MAVHAELASHQLDQAANNGQPQASAAIFSGGGAVALLKIFEQFLALDLVYPDTCVAHGKAQHHLMIMALDHRHRDLDLASVGKFDGVIGVVDQNLSQTQWIAKQVWRHVTRDVHNQLQTLIGCFFGHQADHVIQQVLQLEVDDFRAHLAGLNFRQVKDVVDDAQQMVAGGLDPAQVIALPGCEFSALDQVRHANDGVHGGSNLMAHVGQKIRLHAGCALGLGQGVAQGQRALRHNLLQVPVEPTQLVFTIFQGKVQGYPGQYHLLVNRLMDEIHSALGQGTGFAFGIAFGSDKDHRDAPHVRVSFEHGTHRIPIHAGHHHVQQDQVRPLVPDQRQALSPRRGELNVVVAGQDLPENLHVLDNVVDDEYSGFGRHGGVSGAWLPA